MIDLLKVAVSDLDVLVTNINMMYDEEIRMKSVLYKELRNTGELLKKADYQSWVQWVAHLQNEHGIIFPEGCIKREE